jgi:hypothetical protein
MNKPMRLLPLFALALLGSGFLQTSNAQGVFVRGIVMEQPDGSPEEIALRFMADPTQRPKPLNGANVILYALADTLTPVRATTAGIDGRFELTRVNSGDYLLKVTFVGYQSFSRRINVGRDDINRNLIFLKVDPLKLDEVTVSGLRAEVEVKGDTVVYNADGIKLNPDATAEDLVKRLPGITVENGQVQALGEQVRRVLVDGQEFFGDDAALTLRNLPADMVGSVEMFDQLSDQSRFTGFRDGNTSRALNIISRPGMNVGRFGKGNVSGGTDSKYLGSGNVNYFNGPRRISLLGMSNNLNQQNFSSDDLSGVNQASGGGGGGFPGMQMIRMVGGGGGGRWGGGGGASSNFLTGQQSGINTVHSLGLNYIDRLNNNKTSINASYFFNASDNTNTQSLERQFLNEFNSDQRYSESTNSTSDAMNHRINGRIEHTFNPVYSMIVTPRIRFSNSERNSFENSRTVNLADALINRNGGFSTNNSFTYDISNTVLVRRRFETRGRTLSLNLRTDVNNNRGEQNQDLVSEFFTPVYRRTETDQLTEIRSDDYTLSADFQYTEPIGTKAQVQVGYNPSLSRNRSDRDAFTPTVLNDDLTSRFVNYTHTQRAQVGYRFNDEKVNWNANLSYQFTDLNGEQTYPYVTDTRKTYHHLLPSAFYRYTVKPGTNVNVDYRLNTRMPSANQLQDVVDNTNPLQLRGGNAGLDPQFTNSASVRYQQANIQKATFFFGVLSLNYTTDYIGNRTFIATRDTLIRPGITMGAGSRFTSPDNIGDSWNIRSFSNFTRPLTVIKSNISLNGGLSYTMQPSLDNGVRSESKTVGLTGGSSLNSNISQNLDFSLSYFGTYSIVENPAALGVNSNYYTGRAFGRVNVLPKGKFLLNSDLNVTHYSGLGDEFNQNTVYWNATAGYKFLTNNAAEVKVTIYDILGQNNSVQRTVNDGYIEDVRSQVLTRFAMVSFSYNFRNFRNQVGPAR